MSTDSVTPAQLRAARAMLGLSQDQVAEMAGITRKTLAGIESGNGQAFVSTLIKVVEYLSSAGIDFIDTPSGRGVILRPGSDDT